MSRPESNCLAAAFRRWFVSGCVMFGFMLAIATAWATNQNPSKAAAAQTKSPARAASGRDWLRPEAGQSKAIPAGSHLGSWAVLGMAGLAGAALLYYRSKRRRQVKKQFGGAQIHVLSQSRVGPKAHAVAVEFAGNVLVLGVTDKTVRCLQRLSKYEVAEALAATDEEEPQIALSPAAEGRASRDQEQTRFGEYLDRSLEVVVPPRTAAEQLAESVWDRSQLSQPKHELVDVEGQAAGLAARLQKRFER